MTKEGDVVTTSCSKKTLRLFHQLLQQVEEVTVTQQVSFLFPSKSFMYFSNSDPSGLATGVDVVVLTLSGLRAGQVGVCSC